MKTRRFLLAVSGGTDSVALLPLFHEFAQRYGTQAVVGCVNHGETRIPAVAAYRLQAQELVGALCGRYGFQFCSPNPVEVCQSESTTKSEQDLRKLRMQCLLDWQKESGSDYVVLAHHHDDLLETRLIRLVRGTGVKGLEAMKTKNGFWLRPFLTLPKSRVLQYPSQYQVHGLLDPSNEDERIFRNWIRRKWLPQLDSYRPGGADVLARSLSLLVEGLGEREVPGDSENTVPDLVLPRKKLSGCDRTEVRSILHRFVGGLGLRDISLAQLAEVAKRLDTERKNLRFKVGPYLWTANAEQVRVDHLAEDPAN